MILVRSIRRRLVTGFTVALVLFLLMAGLAIWGLVRHQNAISGLRDVVHHSPNKEKLVIAVTAILRPLMARVDLSQDAAVRQVKEKYRERVSTARTEAATFFSRCEAEERKARRWQLRRQHLLEGHRRAVDERLQQMETELVAEIDANRYESLVERTGMFQRVRSRTNANITEILSHLSGERLPSYDKENFVEASLEKESRLSTLLLRRAIILIVIALITYGVTLLCAFRWVSNPLRAIVRGASRIANGDTQYRMRRMLRWNDEFADLTENFNLMADRFQESENQLNAKVEERSRQLVRSERLAGVGFLAAGLAHEINSPLQSISMAAESAQHRLYDYLDPDNEDTREAMDRLSMIQRESRRCGEITRRMLDFARSERHEKQMDDLAQVIAEVLAMIRPMRRYDGRRIVFDRTAPLMIEMNAAQMKQVMLNLIANALQATPAGGTVEVALEEQTDWATVRVIDTGSGMNADDLERLFEPFFTTKEAGAGTGLGLSITHRIVEEHHGTIDPQSDGPGQGSTFVVRLPRRQPQQVAA